MLKFSPVLIYVFVFLVSSNFLFAQRIEKDIQLNWKGIKEFRVSDELVNRFLYFEDAQLSAGNISMPLFSMQHNLQSSFHQVVVELSDLQFVPVSEKELAYLDKDLIKNSIEIKSSVNYFRFQPVATVSFFPFQKNPVTNSYEKLVSAKLIIDPIRGTAPFKQRSANRSFVSNSVLAPGSGDWYKIAVLQDGVYKITYDFLNARGIDMTSLSSNAINIYGNGFGLLPEYNSDFRPDDLSKNAIYVVDGGDGTFDSGDYLLFYGKGAHKWTYNQSSGYYSHIKHMYCDTSYYYININSIAPNPKRVASFPSSTSSVTHLVNSFDDHQFIESDVVNFIKSGREWFGDLFDFVTSYTYTFNFPNIDNSQPTYIKADMAAKTPGSGSSSFTITDIGTNTSASISIPGVGTGTYVAAANMGAQILSFNPASSVIQIRADFNKFSSSAQGWTNYIDAVARRMLVTDGNGLVFRDKNSVGIGNIANYFISCPDPNLIVWEVTQSADAFQIQTTFAAGNHSFVWNADTLREYVAFNPSKITATPIYIAPVENQNLHALPKADLILITHPKFYNQAAQLAQFHSDEGVSTHLVTTSQVYNEFSSGMKDATAIKQFLRMFYERAAGDTSLLPKYLLLFGDGSYDNRDRPSGNTAYIPTYQSVNSTYITISFSSDDYFVLLDPNENMGNSDQLDMAVGRFPVRTTTEAQAVVNKVIAYATNTGSTSTDNSADCCGVNNVYSMGEWRNMYAFVTDDEDFNAYIDAGEIFADTLKSNFPFVNIEKIFIDAYLQQSTPGGERYPDASLALKERVEKGALVINYIGHGGEVGWAHERILDVATINGWTNKPRLPLFMTATCEFSRFDDPSRVSAGEYVLLNVNGGGIALFTTTRLVYSGPNEILNKHFNSLVLQKVNSYPQRLGDIFLRTKNLTITQIATSNTRNFTLLGDPALRLAIPHYQIATDSVNGVALSAGVDTLKALTQVTITGHIQDYNGNKLSGFNGLIYPTVYDKEQILYSLANDPNSIVKPFDLRKNVIYKGKATVTNGDYSYSFVVPKDINYQYGGGKLSLYAQNGTDDATGAELSVIVGGSNPNPPTDNQGPLIELFMNDENFVSGGMTDEKPMLFAKVQDENGINTVGTGIGHDITAIIDGNTANPIVLNDYYESDVNTYKSGTISYHFEGLAEGKHTLKLKVWDVFNNSSETEIEFNVVKNTDIALEHVLNYPNPFTTRTQFFFEHNQVCSSLDVQIQIFTVSGKLVKTIHESVPTEGFRVLPIEWDAKDDFGDRLAIGTYIYRLKVKTPDGKTLEKFEKLVILN